MARVPLRVQKLLLFASPLNGSGLAEVARFISWRHNQLAQLCRQSDLLDSINRSWINLQMERKIQVRLVVAGSDSVVDEGSARGFPGNPEIDVLVNCGHLDCVKPRALTDLSYLIFKDFVRSRWNAAETVSPTPEQEPEKTIARKVEPKPKLSEGCPPEALLEGARIEAEIPGLRILMTVRNLGAAPLVVTHVATEVIEAFNRVEFFTGARVQMSVELGKSTLWDGRVYNLGEGQTESFDIECKVIGGDHEPIIYIGFRVGYHGAKSGNKIEPCEQIVLFDSLEKHCEILDQNRLLDEVREFPFYPRNLKLCLSYLNFLGWGDNSFQEHLIDLCMAACQRFETRARQAGSFKDIERATEIKRLLSIGFQKRSHAEYAAVRLAAFHPIYLRYFGEAAAVRGELKQLILSLWDPLGVRLNLSRHDEYDELISELESVIFYFAYQGERLHPSVQNEIEQSLRKVPFASPDIFKADEIRPLIEGIEKLARKLRAREVSGEL
jgi:hypothetical protein